MTEPKDTRVHFFDLTFSPPSPLPPSTPTGDSVEKDLEIKMRDVANRMHKAIEVSLDSLRRHTQSQSQ